jgi:hypothetical protein
MHLINDIKLLVVLGKNGILPHLEAKSALRISAVRLRDYSAKWGLDVQQYCPHVEQLFSDGDCGAWTLDKLTHLTRGDADSFTSLIRIRYPLFAQGKILDWRSLPNSWESHMKPQIPSSVE